MYQTPLNRDNQYSTDRVRHCLFILYKISSRVHGKLVDPSENLTFDSPLTSIHLDSVSITIQKNGHMMEKININKFMMSSLTP